MEAYTEASVVIAIFDNARQVVKVEKECREKGIQTTIRPIPKQFSSECGMCIEVRKEDRQSLLLTVTNIGFTPQIYEL